jgi:hypothetical protein
VAIFQLAWVDRFDCGAAWSMSTHDGAESLAKVLRLLSLGNRLAVVSAYTLEQVLEKVQLACQSLRVL